MTSDATSKSDIVFDSATIGLFNNATNDHIANLTFLLSGGASNIQLVAGSFIGDITLNTLLGLVVLVVSIAIRISAPALWVALLQLEASFW
ncbi:hypothetical protein [Nitrosospira multiformis]|uniref:Uncharacterized protein n=1 Tax=Nitrosospira multiformis TaxID=1231 RepID=A0A1I7FH68_9PROT|nr:hypothetical protein [Nitrosospira multiformis]SFU35540.1 hypothetical protein SAMN05216417_101480 [Nitrosospira multiformis]